MLKWTLRSPADSIFTSQSEFSCVPSVRYSTSESKDDVKCNFEDLEDSNKCWYGSEIKIAQVKATHKIVQFSSKENVRYIENDEDCLKENSSNFQKALAAGNSEGEEPKKKQKSHKSTTCNALDPLGLFTGDVTDSDTGSYYMFLERTPAALTTQHTTPATDPKSDPRRRPFIDISNGDYSDLRLHLKQMQEKKTEEEMNFHEQLKYYKHQLIPPKKHKHVKSLHQHTKHVSIDVTHESQPPPVMKRESSLSVKQTYPDSITTTSITTTNTNVPIVTSNSTSNIKHASIKPSSSFQSKFKRHSIADIPSSCITEFTSDDNRPKKDNTNKVYKKILEIRNRKKLKKEPIYEQIKPPKTTMEKDGYEITELPCFKSIMYSNNLYLMVADNKPNKYDLKNQEKQDIPNTCDFTSKPGKNIHKPVPIKPKVETPYELYKNTPLRYCSPICKKGTQHCSMHSELQAHYENVDGNKNHQVYHKRNGQHVHSTNGHHVPLHNLRPPTSVPCKIKKHSTHLSLNSDSQSKPHSKTDKSDSDSISGSTYGCHSNQSSDPDSGVSEGISTPLISPTDPVSQSPNGDSVLEESRSPTMRVRGDICDTIKSFDFNDCKNMFFYEDLDKTISSDDAQQGFSRGEMVDHSTPQKFGCQEIGNLVTGAVDRNLFQTPVHDRTLWRRHSFASGSEYNSPKIETDDDTSVWSKENSVENGPANLRKARSLLSVSPVLKTDLVSLIDPERKGYENSIVNSFYFSQHENSPNSQLKNTPTKDTGSYPIGDGKCYPISDIRVNSSSSRAVQTQPHQENFFHAPPAQITQRDFPSSLRYSIPSLPDHSTEEPMTDLSKVGKLAPSHFQSVEQYCSVKADVSCSDSDSHGQCHDLLELDDKDWSIEAILDDSSDIEQITLDSSSESVNSLNIESPDNFSVCTLESELADSVYLGPKVREKIQQIAQEKMFDKLRKSFRKKEKYQPKVGIFMFVDNPMYVSPEVKKEAKIVTFTPKMKRTYRAKPKEPTNSTWYVNNPMYKSPSPGKENRSVVSPGTAKCEQENVRNSASHNHVRSPLNRIWCQNNPGYESPEIKPLYYNKITPNHVPIGVSKIINRPLPIPNDHYLTPLPKFEPEVFEDKQILNLQKFVDHEYSTIPGQNDSWASESSGSPPAKRTLQFEQKEPCAPQKPKTKIPSTPSRMWRQSESNLQSTPSKSSSSILPLKGRSHMTPRAVKRELKRRVDSKNSLPPDLPKIPAPPIPVSDEVDESFQLPPDSIYEALSTVPSKRASTTSGISSQESTSSQFDKPSSSTSSGVYSERSKVSKKRKRPISSVQTKSKSGSLTDVSVRSLKLGKTRGKISGSKVNKYKARDVLHGKVIEGRKLKSRYSNICNPYVKISLVPDSCERTFCRTTLHKMTNSPIFDQKFSFDFLPEDLEKRLLISVWNRDISKKKSEFMGCMSFSVAHITSKKISGWFRLLTEGVGRRKHFAVNYLNTSLDNSKRMIDYVVEEGESSEALVAATKIQPIIKDIKKRPIQQETVASRKALPEVSMFHAPVFPVADKRPVIKSCNIDDKLSAHGQTPYTITVSISRDFYGYGFSVSWSRPPRVERVEPGRAADRGGLKPGDYIIFVGQKNVVKVDENTVLNAIKESGDILILEVYRQGVSRTPDTLLNGSARPPVVDAGNFSRIGSLSRKQPLYPKEVHKCTHYKALANDHLHGCPARETDNNPMSLQQAVINTDRISNHSHHSSYIDLQHRLTRKRLFQHPLVHFTF